jgi:acetyl esterase/lipase
MLRICTPAFLALALLISSAAAQSVKRDIPYTTSPQTQTADLYTPAGAGPFPAILYIHGGSWRSGNKREYEKLATDLAAEGYAGFSIDYDLDSKSFPTSWQQGREAIQFLRAHASEYHLDPNRIAVAGDSAGGELAALLALSPEGPPDAPGHTPVKVAAALFFNGIYDLNLDAGVITRYLGVACGTGDPICIAASPMHYIHSGAPPIFVGHGTSDEVVPYAQATALIDALRGHQDSVATYVANGGHHSYWREREFYEPNLQAVEAFLSKTLRP